MAGSIAPAPVVAPGSVTSPSNESDAPIVVGPGLDEPGVTIVQAAAGHVEPAPAAQTQAPAQAPAETETAAEDKKPQDPIAQLRAEFDEKLRKVQSTKDAEVAAAKAEAYRIKQEQAAAQAKYNQELAQYRQWQAEQAEAERQRQIAEQEAQKKAWLAAQPPEVQAAFAAADQAMQQERAAQQAEQAQKAQQMAWLAVNRGIPPAIINEAMQKFGTPEAIYHATENYLNWQYFQENVAGGAPKLQELKAKVQARLAALTPEERARVLAQAKAPTRPPAAAASAPAAAPVPQVTPGSTGNQPPSDLSAQFTDAYKRRDYARMAELRRQIGLSSGVDKTQPD